MLHFSVSRAAATAAPPFIVTASSGPAAGSHIVATVARDVGGTNVTLPAALVPSLRPGDVVNLDFPGYRRPPSSVNYHVNVAFVTETARQHWLFERSGPMDRLFDNSRHRRKGTVERSGQIHFVYGTGNNRGIPIFFIIPEDAKTRGVDGVRDYVGAHPTDFVDMSQSTNNAVDQYSFLRDFLSSLGTGSIDPSAARSRIETLAQSVGVSPAVIDGCYTMGGTPGDVQNCIQQAVNSVIYQTNFNAPTQGQFLGGVVGAASPVAYAPYIASLLTVWRLFVKTGHVEYEYLPSTVTLADASTVKRDELLMGLKIPTIRPPAAASDVLFFTIGDPQAAGHAPVVINEAPANGECLRTNRFSIPLHFDHTSRYVHDAALTVTPDGHAPYTIPLDPRSLDAPVVDRSRFTGSTNGAYAVALTGRFGFEPVKQPAQMTARVVFPNKTPWAVAAVPHHSPVAGGTLDVIASSAAAPCLSRAELQIGSAAPTPLTATQLDARRVELRAPLTGVPAGTATIRLYQDDPRAGDQIEMSSTLAIAAPPSQVDLKSAIASIGDTFLDLAGSGFERIRAVIIHGTSYAKEASANAAAACFDGPPLGSDGLTAGQHVTAQLVPSDGSAGQVFPLTIAARRPALAPVVTSGSPTDVHLSTATLPMSLLGAGGPLPRQLTVRVRQNAPSATPCDALRPDGTAVVVPASAVHPRSATSVAIDFRPAILGDRAFGSLQVQVVDGATTLGSNWQSVPGVFARAPTVAQIVCPADATATCRLYGSGLAAIDAVQDATGQFLAPNVDCPTTDKGVACVYVPHAAHYTVRLVDGGVIEPLPDTLLAKPS